MDVDNDAVVVGDNNAVVAVVAGDINVVVADGADNNVAVAGDINVAVVDDADNGAVAVGDNNAAVAVVAGDMNVAVADDAANNAAVAGGINVAVADDADLDEILNAAVEGDAKAHLYRAPAAGDRAKMGLVTISYRPGVFPADRKAATKIVLKSLKIAVAAANSQGGRQLALGDFSFVCVQEIHKSEEKHYHIVVVYSGEKTTIWAGLLDASASVLPFHVSILRGGKGIAHENAMLEYVLVPRAEKFGIDTTPLAVGDFVIPRQIFAKQKTEITRLSNRPANNSEVYDFVKKSFETGGTKPISNVAMFEKALNTQKKNDSNGEASETQKNIMNARLSKWRAKLGSKAAVELADMASRAFRATEYGEFTLREHHNASKTAACTCLNAGKEIPEFEFYNSMIALLEYHDMHDALLNPSAATASPSAKLGDFLMRCVFEDRVSRDRTLCVQGDPGCGKTSLIRIMLGVVPKDLQPFTIFSPTFKSNFPYHGWSPSVICLFLNDFRLADVEASSILKILELDQSVKMEYKNGGYQELTQSNMPIILSTNTLSLDDRSKFKYHWEHVDLAALLSRFFVFQDRSQAITLSAKLPDALSSACKVDCLHHHCPRCSSKFIDYCVSSFGKWECQRGSETGPSAKKLKVG